MIAVLATAAVFLGVWWIRRTDIRGQYAMVAAQVLWGIYAIAKGEWVLAVQSAVLLALTLDAARVWTQRGVKRV